MDITFVKKIMKDGTSCRKCGEVEQRLQQAGLMERIDHVVIADESDLESAGMQLARQHKVDLAPFFIVREQGGQERIYTSYLKFLREVLSPPPDTDNS